MDRPNTSQIVIDEFAKIIDSQDNKGFEKYGKTIDEANDEDYNWMEMAGEELADMFKYFTKEIIHLRKELHSMKIDNNYLSLRLKMAVEKIKELGDTI